MVGLVAGFSRGWLDRIISFVIDLFLSFPFLLGALTLAPILVSRFGRTPGLAGLRAEDLADPDPGDLRLDGSGPTDPRPGALAARARVHPGRAGHRRARPAGSCSRSCCPTWSRRSSSRSRWACRRTSPPRPDCRSSGIGLTGEPSLGQIINKARGYYDTYPLYLFVPVGVDRRARARPEPAGRLGAGRVRPQDSPVTKVHRSGITTERVASTMRRTTRALVALSAACALALSACGGRRRRRRQGRQRRRQAVRRTVRRRDTGDAIDPDREGPVEIEGAAGRRHRQGHRRHPARDDGPERDLLRPHQRDRQRPGEPVADPVRLSRTTKPSPGPRPRHRHRHAERGLHRVEVHDPRRREVRGRHARDRRGRQVRHGADDGPRHVPGVARLLQQAVLRGRRGLHRPVHRQGCRARLDLGGRHDHHHQDGQAVPGHAVLGRVPGQRPDPGRRRVRPGQVQEPPAVDRPVQVRRLHARRRR